MGYIKINQSVYIVSSRVLLYYVLYKFVCRKSVVVICMGKSKRSWQQIYMNCCVVYSLLVTDLAMFLVSMIDCLTTMYTYIMR